MRIAICDDEKLFCSTLEKQLKKYLTALQISHEIAVFSTPSALYDAMASIGQADPFHLIFMDLEFSTPTEDGIIWSKRIHSSFPNTLLIILTSYQERYKEGYVARAFRFMTKPLEEGELLQNLSDCMDELQIGTHICITTNGITKRISSKDILYLSAQSGGSEIHGLSHIYFQEESLVHFENLLPAHAFFRCHKKYLVNLHHISEVANHTITLTNNEKLPVSRRKWTALRLAYMKFDIRHHY